MSLKEDIEKIWNESTDDMETIVKKGIELIKKSLSQKSELPVETVIDILITANNTLGYGGDYEEAELLIEIYLLALNTENPSDISKVHHFTCLIFGVIYSLLSVDEATSIRKVPITLKQLGAKDNSSRLLRTCDPLFHNATPSYWALELVSFIITGICLIKDFDKLVDEDVKIENSIKNMISINRDNNAIEKWKGRWIEASDYHRFTSTLIFAKHSKEENAWLNRVKTLFE
ncbi:MAG: hypothetical protein ACW99Q_29195 [Candidatus Kariarchaeaceae archaeon]|jgi:hypothetical protein